MRSGQTEDSEITFKGQNINSSLVKSYSHYFYGMAADITNVIQGIPDLNTATYTLTYEINDDANTYYGNGIVLRGWSLLVFYEELTWSSVFINFYNVPTFSLACFYAIGNADANTSVISWEGDAILGQGKS